MSHNPHTAGAYAGRVVLATGFFLLLSLWKGCAELRYKFKGAESIAMVTEVRQVGNDRRGRQQWQVNYRFPVTTGKEVTSGAIVTNDEPPAQVGDRFDISYLTADPDRNTPTASRSDFYLWVIGLLTAAVTIALGVLIKQSVADAKREAAYERAQMPRR